MNQTPFHEKNLVEHSFPFVTLDSPKKPFWFPLHWHEQIEIVYVLKGSLKAQVNGKIWDAVEGDIFVLDTGLIHGFTDPSPTSTVRIFHIGRDVFDDPLEAVFAIGPRIRQDDPAYSRFKDLLMILTEEYQAKKPGYRFIIKAKLFEIATLILRDMEKNGELPVMKNINERHHTQYLERVFSFIYSHYDDPELKLDDAARDVGLSKYYLSRFLKMRTGLGFHEHLARARLGKAKQLIAQSDMAILDIAYRCGFQSLATFNRSFKDYTGTNPSAYRK